MKAAGAAEYLMVYVTVPSQAVGEQLANSLVKARLAACVNIVPQLTSIYTWQGKLEKDGELLLLIKSRKSLFSELAAAVKKEHPYDCPEVVGVELAAVSDDYGAFLDTNLKAPEQ